MHGLDGPTQPQGRHQSLDLGYIQPLGDFGTLWPLGWCNSEVHFRDQQTMVRPTFRPTHGLCDHHILSVPLPNNDVVQRMPMLGAGVHPGCLVTVGDTEEGVSDEKTMGGTELKKELTVAVALDNALRSQHSLPRLVVSADLGVEVTQKDEPVRLGHGGHWVDKVLVEPLLDLVGDGRGGSVGFDQGGKLFLGE